MRVLNDKEERTETSDVGFLSLLSHVLMVSLGMATFVFAPIPMILSHMRLLEPWSKGAVVGGAIVALVVLEVPVSAVLMTFVFGLYISDAVSKKTLSVWSLLGSASLIALCVSTAVLFTEASFERMNLVVYWNGVVENFVQQMKDLIQTGAPVEWSLIQGLLFYEGPFLLISAAILSTWVSIGVCAHAGWLGEKNVYISAALRKLNPSVPLSLSFIVVLLASRLMTSEYQHLFAGFGRVLAALLFVQGTVVLSKWMAVKNFRLPLRTVFYSFFILLGFYALIGIGLFSPLFWRKKVGKGIPENISLMKVEETI